MYVYYFVQWVILRGKAGTAGSQASAQCIFPNTLGWLKSAMLMKISSAG